jgi:hypothetical protein
VYRILDFHERAALPPLNPPEESVVGCEKATCTGLFRAGKVKRIESAVAKPFEICCAFQAVFRQDDPRGRVRQEPHRLRANLGIGVTEHLRFNDLACDP